MVTIPDDTLRDIINLCPPQMTTEQYIAVILQSWIIDHQKFCPECETQYTGKQCPCKAGERL